MNAKSRLKTVLRRVVSRADARWRALAMPPPDAWHQRYSVGRGTYGTPRILVHGSTSSLRVGAFCSIADEVQIFLGGEHRTDWISTYPFNVFAAKWPAAAGREGHPFSRGDVVIGNDVWIGRGATIRSGVTIGDGACIGARALVTRDVAPYTIVAGNPARTVRKRFSDEEIAMLLEIRWWDWPDDVIAGAVHLLQSTALDELFAYARENAQRASSES